MSAKRPLLSPEPAGDEDAFAPTRVTAGYANTAPVATDTAWAVAFKVNVAITLLSVRVTFSFFHLEVFVSLDVTAPAAQREGKKLKLPIVVVS